MKTKPAEPIPTAFPTCGEIFHFGIAALDLTAWADAVSDTKLRTESEIRKLSDQLRDWATELDGRAPTRAELEKFIGNQTQLLPEKDGLDFVLINAWRNLLDAHVNKVIENPAYQSRAETRSWYAQEQAPRILYFLWILQKLFRRLASSAGPMLDDTLYSLLKKAWVPAEVNASGTKHRLQPICFEFYAKIFSDDSHEVDLKTTTAWQSGEDRPTFKLIGRRFKNCEDNLGIILNFAFARLLEEITCVLEKSIPAEAWQDCRSLLLEQARCMQDVDGGVADNLTEMPKISLMDYSKLLSWHLYRYDEFLNQLPRNGAVALDLNLAKFRAYADYEQRLLRIPLPASCGKFIERFELLWKESSLQLFKTDFTAMEKELADLRATFPDWSQAFEGALLAIEARISLCRPSTFASLTAAFRLYQKSVEKTRYQTGQFMAPTISEALGFGALLHRKESGEGPIKPWLKNVLDWWDLLGLGADFNHEKLEQRIEKAEINFTDRLHPKIREQLKATFPHLGLHHQNLGGMFTFVDRQYVEDLRGRPLDPRQNFR